MVGVYALNVHSTHSRHRTRLPLLHASFGNHIPLDSDIGPMDVPGRYQPFTTNLTLPMVEMWRLNRHRAGSENRIAELKQGFGLTGFCRDSFWRKKVAFQIVLLSYNLMNMFPQVYYILTPPFFALRGLRSLRIQIDQADQYYFSLSPSTSVA
ncbi:MAG: hypothetical protein KC588_06015 [Nitrospira sp.]|nr:hypothetical protein [Nitrospira sp.]